ncbi:type IV pilus assembly protein PilY1 [Nitrosomonas aestuarii]|nr:type IV pilus assembly protein PilY1 [Nitrosomonas aestuarii]
MDGANKMLIKMNKIIFSIWLLTVSSVVWSEDIDLFTGLTLPGAANIPNVLFVIDNTANWNSAFNNEMNALRTVLNDIEPNKFKFGFMMFTESGGADGNPNGAYVRAALRLMDSANKQLYLNLLNSFDKNTDKSSGGKIGVSMAEAYYYLSGGQAYAGHNKVKRDHAGNISGTVASNAVYALPGNAFSSSLDSNYTSPLDFACQKNFIIYISNGPAQDNSSDKASANSQLAALGGNTSEISLSPSGSQSNPGDEWARYMAKDAPITVRTYTIDVNPVATGQGPGFTALLKSMAAYGKGKYFSVNSSIDNGAQITDAIKRILSEIQAVNTVFASASLPVSVNTQGTHLNQIFVGMFRPDISALPRWHGNLKQYQFKASLTGEGIALNLVDADEALAINKNTGFIAQCSRTFWTPNTTNLDTYWSFKPDGSCLAIANSDISNTPDGEVVEKGAAGYQLRSITPDSRIIKTCNPAGCSGLADFNVANNAITQSLLGVSGSAARTKLINWARGQDTLDENGNSNTIEMRPSAHGDVVHSRPVAVDYGGSTGVVVFYGANDGFLHAINGNQTSGIGSFHAGSELWSFIAPEHYGKLKRLYDNTLGITLPTVNDGTQKPYFFDGPITAHKSASVTWLYATQRRGGRMIYAFDVTSPTNPALKWRQGCPNQNNDTDCTNAGIVDIGQTWSAAQVFKSSGYEVAGTPQPMLIIGGGYDTCEDGTILSDLNTCTGALKGNKIYILDADSGALLKTFTTARSVAATVTVVPNKITGLADYAYAVDTGGNIYRVTMGADLPANWSMVKIASLGCDTSICPGGVANRKLLFAPEVVVTPNFNAILVGSGDREHPLLTHFTTTSVDNAFFMIKDNPADPTWWLSEVPICNGQALACMTSLLPIDPDDMNIPSETDLAAKKGWYLAFGSGDHDKEQVVTSAVVAMGTVTFSTNGPILPDPSLCGTNLGKARVYNMGFLDARPIGGTRYGVITGGGLPPSPVAGMVTVVHPATGGNITVPFIIGANPDSPLEGASPKAAATPASVKRRAYWYLQQ